MGTLEYLKEKNYSLDKVLTDKDKQEILKENENIDCSYLSLIKEMFSYEITVRDLLRGWGGVSLFTLK